MTIKTPSDVVEASWGAGVNGRPYALGRKGPFGFLAQVSPPSSLADAKTMAREYSSAGVDGLILSYDGDLPDAFLSNLDVVLALNGS